MNTYYKERERERIKDRMRKREREGRRVALATMYIFAEK